jgi:hypothetical protein
MESRLRLIDWLFALMVAPWIALAGVGCGRAAPNRLPTGEEVIQTPGRTELRTARHRTIQAPGAPMLDSFPKDIPIYPGAVFRIGSEFEGKLHHTTLDVPEGNIAEIDAYYRRHFAGAGWTIEHDYPKETGSTIQFRKGNRGCRLVVGTTDEGTVALAFLFNDKE